MARRILLISAAAAGCNAAPQSASLPAPDPVRAEYGVATFRFVDDKVVRDSAYPPGAYDVPLDADRAIAFDNDSVQTTICERTNRPPVGLNGGTVKHWRFQCDTSWNGRGVVFVADTQLVLKRGEMLEWKKLDAEPPGARPAMVSAPDLHSYAQVATPAMLSGNVLVSAAWFTGEYPPRKEMDDLRGDSITFGHYRILDRALFIGATPQRASTFLLRSSAPVDVAEPLEWAFFPEDASQKDNSAFRTIWEIPNGYLVRVSYDHDHEGFGSDEVTSLYLYESGNWRLLAKAERFRAW
jgi:hypothetical protein